MAPAFAAGSEAGFAEKRYLTVLQNVDAPFGGRSKSGSGGQYR
jgi:hypothetical protein